MIKLKKGKEEILYLLTKAIEKYRSETGREIVLNTNRKNYEGLAQLLSDISNQLPHSEATLGHDHYPADNSQTESKYPFRKYDITGGQIKDAISGIVSNPRPFLVDACYIYLFGMGRKAFALNPVDINLTIDTENENYNTIETEASKTQKKFNLKIEKSRIGRTKVLYGLVALLLVALIILSVVYTNAYHKWQTIKEDMSIMPYQPSKAEIDSLEGVWLCYTGSPQARISNENRYHQVVSNVMEIKYKEGYFTLTRYGASFNHTGYAQFEAPNLISIYSRVKGNADSTTSPRHSLLTLNTGTKYLPAISASWNFDVGEKNKIIGIREVFIKQGKGGNIEEVMNQIENSSCQCKVIRWHQDDDKVKTFFLKNELLDSLHNPSIRSLIDERSILLKDPQDSLIISKTDK